ncbi:MAG: hypothetical protein GY870_02710, partial [archaeon]|nr:hypothetical protein [archaeon]
EYPYYKDNDKCTGCGRCVAICPGLAITLVDYKKDLEHPNVTFAYEIATSKLEKGQKVTVLDNSGVLGNFEVKQTRILKEYPKTQLITVSLPKDIAKRAIGIRTFSHITHESVEIYHKAPLADDAIVCRCERVTAGEIRAWIRKGVTDYNELKAITRTGMGACGGKTCTSLVQKLFREEGIPDKEITKGIFRPIFIEVSLGIFAGLTEEIELGSDRTNNEVKNEVKNETKNKMKEDDNP